MGKREKLSYDNQELVQSLHESTGKGVDAFFPTPQVSGPALTKPTADSSKAVKAKTTNKTKANGQSTGARMHARKHPPKQTRNDASTRHASTDAPTCARMSVELRKAVCVKRHLSSFTFRFRADELERLDAAVDRLNLDKEQPTSKNDVVRLALNWLLMDYEEKGTKSVLAQVLARE